jgi:hypothetical protein
MAVIERKMPGAVSLCPVHADEFYVPDCPDDYRCPDCEETMVRYVPADTYRGAVEALDGIADERAWTLFGPAPTPGRTQNPRVIEGPPLQPLESVDVVPATTLRGAVDRVMLVEAALKSACEDLGLNEDASARYIEEAERGLRLRGGQ